MKTFQQTHGTKQQFTTETLTNINDIFYDYSWYADLIFCQRVISVLKEINEPLSLKQLYSLLCERYGSYFSQISFTKFSKVFKRLVFFLFPSEKYKIYPICDKKDGKTFRTWYGLQPIENNSYDFNSFEKYSNSSSDKQLLIMEEEEKYSDDFFDGKKYPRLKDLEENLEKSFRKPKKRLTKKVK